MPSVMRQSVTFRCRCHEIARDIHTHDIGTAPRGRYRGRTVAASDVEHTHAMREAECGDERIAALAHRLRDAGEVSFLPQRLVGVDGCCCLGRVAHVGAPWSVRPVGR